MMVTVKLSSAGLANIDLLCKYLRLQYQALIRTLLATMVVTTVLQRLLVRHRGLEWFSNGHTYVLSFLSRAYIHIFIWVSTSGQAVYAFKFSTLVVKLK